MLNVNGVWLTGVDELKQSSWQQYPPPKKIRGTTEILLSMAKKISAVGLTLSSFPYPSSGLPLN